MRGESFASLELIYCKTHPLGFLSKREPIKGTNHRPGQVAGLAQVSAQSAGFTNQRSQGRTPEKESEAVMSEVARKWKRGDVHPETGLVFKQYEKSREIWVKAESLARYYERRLQYRNENKEKINQQKRALYQQAPDDHKKRGQVWRQKNIEKCRAIGRAKYQANRQAYIEKAREYCKANPEWRRKFVREWSALKRSNPLHRLIHNHRNRVQAVISRCGLKKTLRTIQYVGCDWPTLKAHLEAKFQPGMTWENYGEWHVDHVVPLASGSTPGELLLLFHFSNLQPLWAKENLSKGAQIPYLQ